MFWSSGKYKTILNIAWPKGLYGSVLGVKVDQRIEINQYYKGFLTGKIGLRQAKFIEKCVEGFSERVKNISRGIDLRK